MAPSLSYWQAVSKTDQAGSYELIECGARRGYCAQVLTPSGEGVFLDGVYAPSPGTLAAAPAQRKTSASAITKKANKALADALGPYLRNVQELTGRDDLEMVVVMDENGCRLAFGTAGPRRNTYRNRPMLHLILRHILMPWKRD